MQTLEGCNFETLADGAILTTNGEKSHKPSHLAPLALTSSDLQRSNRGHAYFRGLYLANGGRYGHSILLMDRKSRKPFHLVLFTLT